MQMRLINGRWYAAFKHRGKFIGYKLDAAKHERKKAAINLGRLIESLERGDDPTFATKKIENRIPEFLKELKCDDGERARAESVIRLHILPFFNGKRIEEITDTDFFSYAEHRERTAGAAKATLIRELRIFSGIVKKPIPKIAYANAGKTQSRALTMGEVLMVQPFVKAQSGEFGADYEMIYQIMAFTALDLKEVVTLKWSSINFETGWITTSRCKTGNPVRVPICRRLMAVLQSIKVRHIGGTVFHGVQPNQVKVAIKRAFTKAGLAGFSSKSLRHFLPSLLHNAGESRDIIRGVLGHSKNSRCTEIYTHTSDVTAKRVISILDAGNNFENEAAK